MSSSTRPIHDVAADLGVAAADLIPYGHYKAKIPLSHASDEASTQKVGRLILVSAITPTPAGEGKTTTSIGLADGLRRAGQSVCLALREPSLGPCMGIKGGATGGGKAMLTPRVDINLHFNGDFHAITAAHNLLAAMVDNHVHFGAQPRLDPRRVVWPRVLDVNDRALRHVTLGLGGVQHGVPRESSFDITAASEIMAILCLSASAEDLRIRLGRIIVGFTAAREPVTANDIGATGAMMALLKDALLPNLVQTEEGTPALVHGGPFANIAHGCNSVIATKMAMASADWTITEAGFGFDLGGEKFLDIKCQSAGLNPSAVVMVATIRALKMHGGVDLKTLEVPEPGAVERGLPNLARHLDSVASFGLPAVVALNRFGADTDAEIDVVRGWCLERGVAFAVSDHFSMGGEGSIELARVVVKTAEASNAQLQPMYQWDEPVRAKIEAVARGVYGADGVIFTKEAMGGLRRVKKLGLDNLPICIAKTQNSVSDNPRLRGRPTGFSITVRGLRINAGAGFIVVLTGDITRMPGLPRQPQALKIDVTDGEITGLR